MARYVIYARKSSESEDRQILSIDSQVHELRKLAVRERVSVEEVLTESKSAKAPGRPIFSELFRRVQRGQIQGVLCWKMDRLARNHMDTGTVLQALADGQLERVITTDRTYTSNGNDRFIGSFELGMATKFIDDLRQNVKRGLRAKREQGWASFRAPLGYLNDRLTKTVIKDPQRFDLVRRCWDLLLTGTVRPSQLLQIANRELGLTTRPSKLLTEHPIHRSAFYALFANPFYMGVLLSPTGERFVAAHPAMVTPEEFARTQEIMGRSGRPRPKHHEFPFTGLLVCGSCGGQVTAEVHTKPSGRRYVYYHCSRNKLSSRCPYQAISGNGLEEQIRQRLGRLTMPAPVLAWAKRTIARSFEHEASQRGKVAELARRALEQLRTEADTLLSLRLQGHISDDEFTAQKHRIEERRVALEIKARSSERSAAEVHTLIQDTFDVAARVGEVFTIGTEVQKRAILELVGSNFTMQGRNLDFCLRKPFSILASAAGCSAWYSAPDDVRTWIEESGEYFAFPECVLELLAKYRTPAESKDGVV